MKIPVFGTIALGRCFLPIAPAGAPRQQASLRRVVAAAMLTGCVLQASAVTASAQTTSYFWKDQAGNGRWSWDFNQWFVGGGGETGSPRSDGGGVFYFQGAGTQTTFINTGFTSGYFPLNSIFLDSGSSGRNYVINMENGGIGIDLFSKIEALSGAGTLTINGAVRLRSAAEINPVGNSITLGNLEMNGQTLNSFGSNSLNITGVVSGTGTYNIKNGGITVTYSGSGGNTFSGGTTVENSSTLVLNKSANTAAIAGALTINSLATVRTDAANQLNNQLVTVNGTLNLNGNSQSTALAGSGTVQLNGSASSGTLTINNAGADTFSGVITDASRTDGALIKTGVGTQILTSANTYDGGTTISQGVLQLGNGGTTGSLATTSTIINNANLTINRSNAVLQGTDFSGSAITGTGSFSQAGGGTTTLNASNSYGGATNVNAGTLVLGHSNALGATTNGTTVSSGASLQLQGGISIGAESLTLAGNNPFGAAYAGTDLTGALRNISGMNTYGGNITLAGTNSQVAIGADAGSLTLTGTITNGGNRLIVLGAGDISISNSISGAGDLLKQDAGTLTVTGNNGFGTGGTNAVFFDKGSIQVGTGGTLGTTNGISNGWINMGASVAGRNGDTNLFIRDSGVTVANPIDIRNYATDVSGNATLGGASMLTSGTGLFSGSIALHDNVILTASETSNITFSGVIQPGGTTDSQTTGQTLVNNVGGGVTKQGTGTVTLSGPNTYAGGTTVGLGTLLVNGGVAGVSSGTGTNAVSVASGATLGGSGAISGATTLTAATLAPGSAAATASNLTFGAGLALNSTSIFEWDMQQVATTDTGASPDPSGTNQGAYDKVVLNGSSNSLTGSGAVFKIVLGSGKSFTNAFWDTSKTWNNVFSGVGTAASLAAIFSTFNANGTNLTAGTVPGEGSFSFAGGDTLNWTAVPEPSSALAGLLIASGLLRRRRA